MAGVIYKQIVEVPEPYDLKKLSRYQKYLWKIKQTPTSRVLRCKEILNSGKRWSNSTDFIRFVYCYMLDIQRYEVLPYINMLKVDDKIEKDIVSLEDDEEFIDYNEINKKYGVDYSAESAKALYSELVKKGLMPEIHDSDRKVITKEATRKNFSPAETMFSKMSDDATVMDVALVISENNK